MMTGLRLKDLDALGLTRARAEIIVRSAEGQPPDVTIFGVPGDTLKALVDHGYADWVLRADAATQLGLGRLVADSVIAARDCLNAVTPDWRGALSLLRRAENLDLDATRRVLRLTNKGLAFALAWKSRNGATAEAR